MRPGAVAVAGSGAFPGATGPSALGETPDPSARSEPSLIAAELAEPYHEDEELRRQYQELEQEDEELRRRLQEYENVQSRAVTAVIVENSGAGNHDQNAASSPFGRKEQRVWRGAALALLVVVGVILGVAIPLTPNNNNASPSSDSVVTPTQSATPTQSPTPAPAAASTACTSLECLRLTEILLQNEVSDAEALQDDSSPQFLALRWLANNDTAVLDLDSTPTVMFVERYVVAVLYFATGGEGWGGQRNFLSATSVCKWNNEERGVFCNEDDVVVALNLGKSKHEEVIFLIALTHLFTLHSV
jgi:hypothetical protein